MHLPPPPAQIQLLVGADVWTAQGPQKGLGLLLGKGKILAVGPVENLYKNNPKAHKVELPGGVLLPGFIEGHAHVNGLGAMAGEVDLVGLDSLPATLTRTREWSGAHAQGWLLGRGWDQNRWTVKTFPRALDLDAFKATQPAFLERVDGHAAWVNTAALTR